MGYCIIICIRMGHGERETCIFYIFIIIFKKGGGLLALKYVTNIGKNVFP